MALSTGRQYARTLETGDRYIAADLDNKRHEVTVSTVSEHLDDSNSVYHQYADPVRYAHHTYSAVVHVTYRAPRCPHGNDWRWCERLRASTANGPPRSTPHTDEGHAARSGSPADRYEAWMIHTRNYRLVSLPERPDAPSGISLDVPILRRRVLRTATLTPDQQHLMDLWNGLMNGA
jgi:hypothetical protein